MRKFGKQYWSNLLPASKNNNAHAHWPISILSILSALLNMGIPLLMVRLLRPEEVGTFKIYSLRLHDADPRSEHRFVQRAGLLGGPRRARTPGNSTLNSFSILVGVAVGLVCLAGAPLISGHFHWPLMYSVFFAASAFGATCAIFLEESWIVTGRVWAGAIYYSGTEAFRSLVVVVAAWVSRDVGAILLASSLVAVVKVLVSLIIAKRQGLIGFKIEREISEGVIRYAVPVSLAALFGIFTTYGDQLVLRRSLRRTSRCTRSDALPCLRS